MSLPIIGDSLLKLIPQSPPIVMVSSLEEYDEQRLVASFQVEEGKLFVDDCGLAESGLLEHMAQSVALHTGYSFYLRHEDAPTGYIGAIQQAEIMSLPNIGDTVYSEVLIRQEFMGVTLVDITTRLADKVIATAKMKTVIAATDT